MRISDWSSDVCSSDLLLAMLRRHFDADRLMATGLAVLLRLPDGASDLAVAREMLAFGMFPAPLSAWYASARDRKSVVEGKRVSVRVDLGGRRIFKKNNRLQIEIKIQIKIMTND